MCSFEVKPPCPTPDLPHFSLIVIIIVSNNKLHNIVDIFILIYLLRYNHTPQINITHIIPSSHSTQFRIRSKLKKNEWSKETRKKLTFDVVNNVILLFLFLFIYLTDDIHFIWAEALSIYCTCSLLMPTTCLQRLKRNEMDW